MKDTLKCLTGGSFRRSLVVTLVLLLLDIVEPKATCHFPQFLQSTTIDGSKKTWSTKKLLLNLRHKPRWVEKTDIYVKDGYILRHRERIQKNCNKSPNFVYKSSFGMCSERKLDYNLTCITEEGYNTYRVIQYNADRTHRFTCMKFVKRSNNVVQVYKGPVSLANDSDLCDAKKFVLDEWPWIAPWNKVSSFCPVSGGFSFRTIRRLTNEDLCEDEWRISSLEIECLRGDGMVFMAPTGSNCNPFLKDGDVKKLTCWAGWESDDFIFMIASDEGRQPSYCLRFPRVQKGHFSVLVYFSVICPPEADGKPDHGIEYYELRMHRKDPSSCRDDHTKCQELAQLPEMCTKDNALFPHCAKTCRQCTTTVTENIRQRRCAFDPILSGDWVLYDQTGTHDVSVHKQEVTMTQMASFHCLTRGKLDINKSMYKTASFFDNGCSPRYTCLELIRPPTTMNILQLRIGPSYREDKKMDELCVFSDDPPPLKDSIRSFHLKNLITKKRNPSYCDLDGVIPFNGTINGRNCQGTVSDWDQKSCTSRGMMVLQSETCKQLILPMEFQCLGFIRDESVPLMKLLVTRSMDGRHSFNCWVITSYFDQAHWPKRMMFQMPNIQCSLLMEVERAQYTSSQIYIYLDDESKHKNCKPDDKINKHHVTQMEMTKATNVTYIIPNQRIPDDEPDIFLNDPKLETATNPPFQSLHSEASFLLTYSSFVYKIISIVLSVFIISFIKSGS